MTLQQHPLPNYEDQGNRLDSAQVSAAEATQSQYEALEELEQALGRPIEEAIEEDRAFAQSLRPLDPDEQSALETTLGLAVPGVENLLEKLRTSGASQEEVAREARQIYGDRLPATALKEDEFKIYKRLYGDPISRSYEEYLDEEEASEVEDETSNQLFDQEGEPVEYEALQEDLLQSVDAPEDGGLDLGQPTPAQGGIDFLSGGDVTPTLLTSPEERARVVARSVNGEILEEGDHEELEEEEEQHQAKMHPFTRLGKFATSPGNVQLSQEDFVGPVKRVMSTFSNKHLREMCEKTFGGPGLPDSPLTPKSGRVRPQYPVPLDAGQHVMGEMEANVFLTTIMPPTYAAIVSVLVETRKRLGTTWLHNLFAKEGGPRILDAGAGGAGILAWREIVKAHWESLHSSDRVPPPAPASKSVVLTGSDALRHRAAGLLENTTFIPQLPDYMHTRDAPTLEDDRPPPTRKQFDIIIAPHSLFRLHEDWMKKQHVQNLWSMLSPEGGVLILIEKGVPRGFEAIAGARELLLEKYIASPEGKRTKYSATHDNDEIGNQEPGMIVAPCTNHEKCPMYTTAGASQGRKDFCSFQQRYIRPSYLQNILGARDRNHDDVDFSYISVMRGDDLRQRKLESWQQLEDGLSAPVHPDPKALSEDYEISMRHCQDGFEDVDPDSDISQSVSSLSDGNVRSSLPGTWNLPRLVFTPMKRRGHVIMDVCTPAGKIERWTVPKSFGKQAYRDARKSQWGDLWALGAKTRTPRNLRLGGPDTKEANRARSRSERIKIQAEELMEKMELEKLEDLEEDRELQTLFEDGDLADELEGRLKRKTLTAPEKKSGKARKEPSAPAQVESFTFDIDENEINPMPPSKARSANKTTSRKAAKSSRASVEAEAHADDTHGGEVEGLTDEDMRSLREWDAELGSTDNTGIKMKGGRPLRVFSKFAAPGQKRGVRKGGRVPRVGRPAGGRSGL